MVKSLKERNKMKFLIGLIVGFLIMFFRETMHRYFIRRRAIEKGWGIFNDDNSSFEWTNKDAEYILDGKVETKKSGKANIFSINGNKK